MHIKCSWKKKIYFFSFLLFRVLKLQKLDKFRFLYYYIPIIIYYSIDFSTLKILKRKINIDHSFTFEKTFFCFFLSNMFLRIKAKHFFPKNLIHKNHQVLFFLTRYLDWFTCTSTEMTFFFLLWIEIILHVCNCFIWFLFYFYFWKVNFL
jgi:hypothetical protein